jgi:hypothetical protein
MQGILISCVSRLLVIGGVPCELVVANCVCLAIQEMLVSLGL